MQNDEVSIPKSHVFWCILLLIPFFIPSSISAGYLMPGLDDVFRLAKFLAFVVIIYLVLRDRYKFGLDTVLLFLFFSVVQFSTWLNNGEFISQFNIACTWIFLFVGVSVLLTSHKTLPLIAISKIVLFLFVLNLVSIVVYPDAMYYSETGMKNWFLGDKNCFVIYAIVGYVAALMDEIINTKKMVVSKLIFVLSFTQVLYVWSVTSIVVMVILALTTVAFHLHIKPFSFLSFKNIIILIIAINLLFIFIGISNSLFTDIVENVFHKDVTLSGRTLIWQYVLSRFPDAPLIGYGLEEYIMTMVVWDGLFYVVHAHNLFLHVLSLGGISGVVLIIGFFAVCLKNACGIFPNIKPLVVIGVLVLGIEYSFDFLQMPIAIIIFAIASSSVPEKLYKNQFTR